MNSPDLLQRFLHHLHRGGSYWYLWVGQTRKSLWGQVDHAIPVPTGSVDAYFGVHPTAKRGSAHERARIGDIAAINAIIAEFDAKDHADKPTALRHIGTLGLRPSVIVDSGGGYHCYWLLRNPFLIQSEADRERARHLQAEWVPLVGGDTAAKDLARVLRFPGSHNCKAQYAPDYPQVTFVDADMNLLYALEDFEQLLPVHTDHFTPHSATAPSGRDAYANAALENELGILMLTTEGHRNDQLNRSAFALGQLIGAGRLDRSAVEQVLLRTATAIGLAQRESLATIQS